MCHPVFFDGHRNGVSPLDPNETCTGERRGALRCQGRKKHELTAPPSVPLMSRHIGARTHRLAPVGKGCRSSTRESHQKGSKAPCPGSVACVAGVACLPLSKGILVRIFP